MLIFSVLFEVSSWAMRNPILDYTAWRETNVPVLSKLYYFWPASSVGLHTMYLGVSFGGHSSGPLESFQWGNIRQYSILNL